MLLGDVIKLNKESLIDIRDFELYKICGVQNYGKGVVIKREVLGSDLTMRKYKEIKANQLMWCKVDTKNGAFGITTKEHEGCLASTNMALADIDIKKAEPKFIELLFRNRFFYEYINSKSTGTTNRKYLKPREICNKIEIPTLSIDEQRIFLEKYNEVENSEMFVEIEKQSRYIQKLRQSILSEAVQGKLVPQNTNDEPASVLLERIKKEKEKLIKEKKIKKEKPLPPISEDEIPYELPKGWEWVRLGEIVKVVAGSTFKSHDFNTTKGVRVIKITNCGVKKFIETEDFLPSYFQEKHPEVIINQDDLIIALTRPYISSGLKVCLCPASYDCSLLNQRVAAIKSIYGINNQYLFNYLTSDYVLNKYKARFSNTGLQPNLKMKDITLLEFPLPPTNEQKRIVQKVDQLMKLCDELEEQVKENQRNSELLMESVLREAFESSH